MPPPDETPIPVPDSRPWQSPGATKEQWKSERNRYTPEELKQMEKMGGLVLLDWETLKIE